MAITNYTYNQDGSLFTFVKDGKRMIKDGSVLRAATSRDFANVG